MASSSTLDDPFSDLMNPVDFNSMEIRVSAENVTTRTRFKSYPATTLQETLERGMTIEGPKASCSTGHRLLIELVVVNPKGAVELKLPLTAVVQKADNVSELTDRITVDLVQYEERMWQKFLEILGRRQGEIDEFLKAAKGL